MSRAVRFYEAVLGVKLELNEMESLTMAWFPMHQDAPGSTGCLIKADSSVPAHPGSTVCFSVEDIDATLRKAATLGGTIPNPRTSIGEYGFVGHFGDSEGNRVALHANS